jgi:hypothetical protein
MKMASLPFCRLESGRVQVLDLEVPPVPVRAAHARAAALGGPGADACPPARDDDRWSCEVGRDGERLAANG